MSVPRSVRVNCSFCSRVSMICRFSVGFRAGGVHDGCPALHFRGHVRGELLRIEIAGLDAFGPEPLANVGKVEDTPHLGVQATDDLGRSPCRPGKGEPDRGRELRIAELAERRQVGEVRHALRRAHRERARFSGLDLRRGGRERRGSHRHMTSDQIGDGEARALVGHKSHLYSGDLFQLLGDQVSLRAVSGRAVGELSAFRLRVRDELLEVLHGKRRMDDEHPGRAAEQRDVREVAQRIERKIPGQRRRDAVRRDPRHDQRVSVGSGLRHELRADHAAGPGAVLDDEILLEAFTEPLPHEPPQRIRGAARSKRHDDAHRLCGPGLSVCTRRPEPEQRDGDKGRCLGIESHGVFTNPSGSLPVEAQRLFYPRRRVRIALRSIHHVPHTGTEPFMEMTGEQLIPLPQAEVWRGLNDPEVLKACIAGCESIERVSDTEYRVAMVAAVGPVKARFNGKLVLSDLKPPNSYSLSFEGSGGAAGFGKGGAQVSLKSEGAGTRLTYSARASVGGKLAQVGSRLIDGVARKMADDFFTAFNEKLAGPAVKPEGATPSAGKSRIHPDWWVAGALLLAFLLYLALQPAH